MRDKSITLAGAGLAGSLLAVYLARRGFRVTVYERRQDMRRANISEGRSINLALANRGIRALRNVGLYKKIAPLLIPMRGRMLHELDGTTSFQPYGKDPSEVIFSISRGGLNKLLMDAAEAHGVALRFGHRCEDIDLESGQLTVKNERDGSVHVTDPGPVIATDGAGSAVRRAMARLPEFQSSEDLAEHAYKELEIPPTPSGGHGIEARALHIWPRGGFMLIALPNLDGSFTVTLFLARSGENSFESLDSPEAVTRFFEATFPDALRLMPDLAEDFFANPTGSMVTVRCKPWRVGGNALLLGDAAHSIVPFHGQGMNCAFEDCEAFDQCLDRNHGDWDAVFADFEQRRKDNADAIAQMALDNYIEMRESVRDPRFHLRKALAWELEKRHPDRFIPRYSLVMFHHVPYADAQHRGVVQQALIDELLGDEDTLDNVDYYLADKLVNERMAAIDPDDLGQALHAVPFDEKAEEQ